MIIVQKIAKIRTFSGHRFWMALEGVLEGVWEAKIIDFGSFFETRSIRNASRNQVEEHVEKISEKKRKSAILEAKKARRQIVC